MPPFALFAQILQTFRYLGPADGIGSILNCIGHIVCDAVFVKLYDQFHIFAHGRVVVSSGGDDHIFFKQTKGTGYDQRTVEFIKEDSGRKEGTIIFQYLHTRQNIIREVIVHHPSPFQCCTIARTDHAADRNHILLFKDRTDNFA